MKKNGPSPSPLFDEFVKTLPPYGDPRDAEIAALRQFHHDQQELHEMNEALQQTNNILREQLSTVTAERDELAEALKQFAECDLNDGNCASLEVATRRIRSLAQAALAKVGADKGE